MRELERALGISYQQARRIVEDEMGEPIVVAAKAMSLPADVLQRILLFMNPRVGQSVDRVYELAALYNEISVEAAQPPGRDPARGGAGRQRTRTRARSTAPRKPRGARYRISPRSRRVSRQVALRRAVGAGDRLKPQCISYATTLSMKWRPARSSTSTIQTSGSKRISRASLSSTFCSGTGSLPKSG